MPWPVHPTGFFGARGDSDTYRIERSLRFNSADSAYLNRTPSSAGNRKTWTLSVWLKLGSITQGERGLIFSRLGGPTVYQDSGLRFAHSWDPAGTDYIRETVGVFRDPSAWYHVVYWCDTTQAGTRWKIYVNGVEQSLQTPSGNNGEPAQNTDLPINSTDIHYLGGDPSYGYFSGYLTEINFIDGQALTPSSFGETDAITGRWKAKAYSGTYGTNGFYLKFADNSGATATTLGKDSSGNGNNWTPNNFSVTAGAGNDSLVDSPTNYGVGTGTVGNFCTWNPLVPGDSAVNGNLDVTNDTARGNHELMKYDAYWEVTSTGGTCLAGIISTAATSTITVGSAKTFGFKLSEAGVFEYANITDGSSFTSQATATTPPFTYASTGASITASINCGQRAFAGTLPTGYKPICTTSLDQPTIQKPSTAMDVVTYTGTGASQSISSLGFSPGLVWIKGRSGATDHALYDVIRGSQARLESNTTDAEVTSDNGLTSFDSAGFTVGTLAQVNTNTATYVGWSWDAGSTNSTNTSGSITSTIRANPQAGFSIVSYTGNGTSGATIGHGLGVKPNMVIIKARTSPTPDASNWIVQHSSLSGGVSGNSSTITLQNLTSVLYLNLTNASGSYIMDGAINKNTITYIAYCFAEIEGYSKFGSYTGNGSADGPFVWCGFRPRWVMVKVSSGATADWIVRDTARGTYNLVSNFLAPSSAAAEATGYDFDILSNGFKVRNTADSGSNGNGYTYIFAAFAEAPFKYARAR